MSVYEAVIGLEVHAQLRTRTKIFCGCSTQFGREPNSNVCPVCTGMPGVLPVLNRTAVEYALKMALAVQCRVNNRSVFARKNYFYPDLPKAYQISQYELPLAEHGHLRIWVDDVERTIGITRIHMEEDAGKSIHSATENKSFVDLNRTGVPLIEIVSEPDLRSADEAVAYLKALRSILVYLEICDGNMEEGSFRCDANISIRPKGVTELGTRTELKNLNSFRHVHKAIEYEISRQAVLLEDGEMIVQETRLYDVDKGITISMRGKEEAHDYRYFPDPDLVPVLVREEQLHTLRQSIPELPQAREARFISEYGLPTTAAQTLTAEKDLAEYFENVVRLGPEPQKVCNWMLTDLLRELNQARIPVAQSPLNPGHLAELLAMIDSGKISTSIAKQIFPEIFATKDSPQAIVERKGLAQISDSGALEAVVDKILAANPKEVEAYKNGKTKLMGFFVGQIMRQTKGQANPDMVNKLILEKLQ
ncbi:aspartyl/glutamyl-tRNA(Asn/Gln) amidotransferase subunit B [Desulfonatronum thiosulfatophilum]|uniref:Aspartyl/glutamyl-tRNA(Asn/Gln) amidotransferase subunit B n=1 Tax=Desulfonatronum thiosulfatophilum TaxID=617002 RepID=A0A1G6C1T6_9BACT|nr:Asp-tRNA(Asn)/Glu-tRNA(Gln) amidotransferase subunit GatB [Desulfonatronum thiosulfatophilum]SDB26778.1 aspartyl/glutamyl-tRNA(Asn/Gln) amidotransferase subunit B [Desulfonatronum thiosulfatophilum]